MTDGLVRTVGTPTGSDGACVLVLAGLASVIGTEGVDRGDRILPVAISAPLTRAPEPLDHRCAERFVCRVARISAC